MYIYIQEYVYTYTCTYTYIVAAQVTQPRSLSAKEFLKSQLSTYFII